MQIVTEKRKKRIEHIEILMSRIIRDLFQHAAYLAICGQISLGKSTILRTKDLDLAG